MNRTKEWPIDPGSGPSMASGCDDDKTCVIGGDCSNTEGTGVAAKGTHDC